MSTHPLPTDFVTAITAQLGADTDGFLASYADPPTHGLRVNPAKVSLERLRELTGWVLEPVPWCSTGAYIDPGVRAGAHPYHAAGLYYLQEPSAMVVAEMADLAPGQSVLDLAAAPGGKSTQIASAIGPRGLLIANEIHAGRIKALGENLERWGAVNVVVTNSSPDQLAGIGPVFDRVIVDAPCSGEGLFRREPDARREWSRARVSGSADRQRDILDAATGLIGPGGELVYSTCTFNQTENEGVVAAVLAGNGDWHVGERRRLWPHLVRGEGHVVHRLGRAGSEPSGNPERRDRLDDPAARLAWDAFSHEHFSSDPIAHLPGKLEWRDHRLMLATGHELDLSRIAVVRDGLWLGERKPGRFEPSHALALAIDPALAPNRLDLEVEAARRWIGGEPVTAAGPAGWVLITVDGFGLGWGKRSASIVKNHYPKGLRRVSREA